MQRAMAPGSSGAGWPVRRQSSAIRAGMLPGPTSASSSGSISEQSEGAASASAMISSNERKWPSDSQLRRHSCSSQSPVTFRSRRKVPATPPSFVKLAAKVSSVISGSSTSRPTSDHVPTLRKAESASRNGTAATAEPVSCVATAITCAPSSGSSDRCRGRYDLRQQAGRDAEAFQEVVGPVARTRVEALRRRRICELARRCPAESVVKKVGDEQKPVGLRRAPDRPPASSRPARRSC